MPTIAILVCRIFVCSHCTYFNLSIRIRTRVRVKTSCLPHLLLEKGSVTLHIHSPCGLIAFQRADIGVVRSPYIRADRCLAVESLAGLWREMWMAGEPLASVLT
jgi:hypothetical protein